VELGEQSDEQVGQRQEREAGLARRDALNNRLRRFEAALPQEAQFPAMVTSSATFRKKKDVIP
jgi:hypothetical protein